MARKGFYDYIVKKADGTPVDENAIYFVLRLDTDRHARKAAHTYAGSCAIENPELHEDLEALLDALESDKPQVEPQ